MSLHQSRVPGWGRAWSRAFPHPEASLPFHLVDGSLQAAEADAELQRPQEVVRGSDQDMQLFIHEAVPGDSFCQMAPGRWKRVQEGPRCPPHQYACPPGPHQFRGSSLGIPAADLLGDLGQVPIPLWVSDSAFPGTEKARGHSGKPKDPPLPWEMPWESELDRSGVKSQYPP